MVTGAQLLSAYRSAGIPRAKAQCMVNYIAANGDAFGAGLDQATAADVGARFGLIDACLLTDEEVDLWMEAQMLLNGMS